MAATSTSEVTIVASPQTVWEALVTPAWVKQWQYGSDLITDWQVGGPIRFHSEWQGKTYEQWGQVLEFVPFERLRYSLFAPRPGLEDRPEHRFVMTYRLSQDDGATRLTIEQEDPRPGAQTTSGGGGEGAGILEGLKTLIENRRTAR